VILGTAGFLADGRPGVVFTFLTVFVGIGGMLAVIMTQLDRRSSSSRSPKPPRKPAGRSDRCGMCATRLESVGGVHICPSCDGVPSRASRPY